MCIRDSLYSVGLGTGTANIPDVYTCVHTTGGTAVRSDAFFGANGRRPAIALKTTSVDLGGVTTNHWVMLKTTNDFFMPDPNSPSVKYIAEGTGFHNATLTFMHAYLMRTNLYDKDTCASNFTSNTTNGFGTEVQPIANHDINPDIAVGASDTLSVSWTITLSV